MLAPDRASQLVWAKAVVANAAARIRATGEPDVSACRQIAWATRRAGELGFTDEIAADLVAAIKELH